MDPCWDEYMEQPQDLEQGNPRMDPGRDEHMEQPWGWWLGRAGHGNLPGPGLIPEQENGEFCPLELLEQVQKMLQDDPRKGWES